ncbi:MAG TPA: DEAD/DEAH box helicase [Burkholderiaceae bacterium]|nr:DEAD/DEAH box helicase [Burkholderiaceae bacterium]
MSDPKDFTHFDLDPLLLTAITEMGYATPTPIQAKAIPVVLRGRDVMGAAQTGTGKTAGFGLPMLQRLLPQANTSMSPARHPVRGLVLTPTRELAEQVADNIKRYASKTALRVAVVYGGVDMDPQTAALRSGVEVVIATPGRLLDHIQQKNTSLSQVQIVVLDEADRMLDMGFLPDISRILNLLPRERQSLMFSATFSEEIKKLANNFLRDPQLIEVARRNATAELITQEVFKLHESQKTDALLEILRTRGPEGGRLTQVLVFVNAKIECRRLARQLQKAGVNADAIHGDKTQEERMKALEGFKQGTIEVLVATDVAARGLDIVELPVVINYDVPFGAEDYVHRIGRTGRAGATGLAIMLATGADERGVVAIEKLTKQKFTVKPLDPERVDRGERAGRRERAPRRDFADRGAGLPPPAPVDDFFTKPYEERDTEAATAEAATPVGESTQRTERKPAKVAALLGGTKR